MENNTFKLDVDQASELKHAFKRNGWTNEDIKKLTTGDILAKHLSVLKGTHKIVINNEHTVNLGIEYFDSLCDEDAPAQNIKSLYVKEHHGSEVARIRNHNGDLYINDRKVVLFHSKKRKPRMTITAYKFLEEISDKQALNVNVLNFLLEHPGLIPENWKHENVLFPGTIFGSGEDDQLAVYLYYYAGKWKWGKQRLGNDRWAPNKLKAFCQLTSGTAAVLEDAA